MPFFEHHQNQHQDPPTPIMSNQTSPVNTTTTMELLDLNGSTCPMMPLNGELSINFLSSSKTPRFSSADEEPIIVQRSSLSPANDHLSRTDSNVELTASASTKKNPSINQNNKSTSITTSRGHFPDWNFWLWLLSDFVRSGLSLDVFRDSLRRLLSVHGPLFQNPLLLVGAGNHPTNLLYNSPTSISSSLSERRRRRLRQQGLPKHIQGLPNQGQTCFMNSVLQSLASLNPFLTYLDGIVQCQEDMKEAGIAMAADPLGLTSGKTSFCRQLLDMLDDINMLDEEEDEDDGEDGNEEGSARSTCPSRWRRRRKSLNPKPLLQMIGESSKQFKSRPFALMEQQDAQELLSALLGVVVEDAHLDALLDRRFVHSSASNEPNPTPTIHAFRPFGDLTKSKSKAVIEDEDEPMTSALASSYFKEEAAQQDTLGDDDLGERSKGLAMENGNSVLSLSGFLLQIESEQQRNAARTSAESVDTISALKPSMCIQQEKQYQEEKKQDYRDGTEVDTTTSTSHDKLSTQTFSMLPLKPMSSDVMRHTISAITPSPLSGWLGSTVQCVKCQHVRPIQNAPFLDLPLVPTSVPSYIASAYHSPSQSAAPSSRSIPPCSLDECLAEFTSVESVKDVECRFCTIQREREHLEEEAMMLRGAIETMEKRLEKKSASTGTTLQSTDSTKYLRDDLHKIEGKLRRLNTMDPDEDDILAVIRDQDPLGSSGDEQVFDLEHKSNPTIERGVARKCLLLTRTPSVLCCHIQRRYFDPFTSRMEKCIQHVDFPDVLDISPYCAYGPRANTPWAAGTSHSGHGRSTAFSGNQERMLYQLSSVVEHRGNAYGGHYVCYRRNQSGQWYLISDESVNPVSWRDVRYSQAYLLFYEAM